MAGHPDAAALVAAVREFIAGLALDGRDGFHAKVAANALAIVERELAQNPDAAEAAAIGMTRAAVCERLRDGRLTLATPGLLDALVAANLARLAVDNPRYSTFLRRTAETAAQR
jgi:hypothetical protein